MELLLQARNLSLSVPGRMLFKDVSLDIHSDDFIVITGPSGSGKSSLLKILAGLEMADSGEIVFRGKNKNEYRPSDYRKQVSYCFQSPQLFDETVYDNLNFPFWIRGKTFDHTVVEDFLTTFNLPLDILQHSVASLSGGEKQRVGLIRNLLFAPAVLLLDEVTSNLDQLNKQIIRQSVVSYQRKYGMAVLWITHDTEEIAAASYLFRLPEKTWREIKHE